MMARTASLLVALVLAEAAGLTVVEAPAGSMLAAYVCQGLLNRDPTSEGVYIDGGTGSMSTYGSDKWCSCASTTAAASSSAATTAAACSFAATTAAACSSAATTAAACSPIFSSISSKSSSTCRWRNATGHATGSEKTVTLAAFLNQCVNSTGKYLRYNADTQKEIMPAILTTASMLGAVPLEDGQVANRGSAAMVFDAVAVFDGFNEWESTNYTWTHFGAQTTGLAKLNPGWRWQGGTLVHQLVNFLNATLTGGQSYALVDFIVKEKLFLMFLKDGCIPLTADHRLMEKILNDKQNKWPKPVRVFGYDNSHPLEGGDLFEAETGCSNEHNMGQIASEGVTNLGFFSRTAPITHPLLQNADPESTGSFNKSKTYVAFIIGDGDNVQYVQHSRQSMMEDRTVRCAAGGGKSNYTACFPLLWSLNPNLLRIAPDWIKWYYNKSYETGADYFVLPPSGTIYPSNGCCTGDTYSYPSQQNSADQAEYIRRTEEDCYLMNTSGSVSWEGVGTWEKAISSYYPEYAKNGIVRTFYSVNVPYDAPVFAFGKNEHYKLLGGGQTPAVLFKPQEWRGTGCASKSLPNSAWSCPTTAEMAARLNGFAAGTVTQIYGTSDGGFGLHTLYDLVPQLAEHVVVVNQNQLAEFAVIAETQKKTERE